MPSSSPVRLPPRKRRPAADSLSGIFAVCLTSALLAGIYFGREVLIPLALASLITFLLTPLVNKVQRWIGNVTAVLFTMTMVLAATVALGWLVGTQAVDLAGQLPGYKENIRTKLRSFQAPSGGVLSRLSETVEDLKKELPGKNGKGGGEATAEAEPMPVEVVKDTTEASPLDTVQSMIGQVAGPLGTACLLYTSPNPRDS